jgi:hypothetical protein
MFRLIFVAFIILSLSCRISYVVAKHAQQPLLLDQDLDTPFKTRTTRHKPRLNFSSSAPHLFASTYTLLQQWSNTIFPNGHSLAPCEIPAYTLFYHGRIGNSTPPSPEWLAFDM